MRTPSTVAKKLNPSWRHSHEELSGKPGAIHSPRYTVAPNGVRYAEKIQGLSYQMDMKQVGVYVVAAIAVTVFLYFATAKPKG